MKDADKQAEPQQSLNTTTTLDDLSNEQLAAHVVAYRHIGINKDLAKDCMKNLMHRKLNGSEFDYEEYIKTKIESMPKTTNDKKSKDILSMLSNLDFNNMD